MVSFIILEYKSLNEVENCISNIQEMCGNLDYEIIVSSNSQYPKDQQNEVESKLKSARFVFNEKNGGFSYGMNRGMEIAKGDYMIICNSDVKIASDLLVMVDYMQNNPDVGVVGPRIEDEPGNVQDSCRDYVSFPALLKRQIKRIFTRKDVIPQKNFDYDKIQNVDWVIGAFLMIRSSIYREIGGFDENNYFMYAEDVDLCLRVRKKGYRICYFPKFIVKFKGTRKARTSFKFAKIFLQSHFKLWQKYGFFCLKKS